MNIKKNDNYKAWYQKNTEAERERGRNKYSRDKDKLKKHRDENKEKINASKRKSDRKNKAKREARRKQRIEEERINNPSKILWTGAKARANKLKREFSIEIEDIIFNEYCPVFKKKLIFNDGPYSPALDRIDNTKGYIPGNIIVVSSRANRLKGDATLEELSQLWEFYKDLNGKNSS